MGTTKFENLKLMHYDDARPLIKTGDILFTSGRYSISLMIQHFSGSMLSHVGFVFKWNARVILLESVEDYGIRAMPLRQYFNDYENSAAPYDGRLFLGRHNGPLDQTKVTQMLGEAADLLHRKYDKDEIAQILARITIGVGKHGDNDAYICSEFVDVCFKKIGIVFPRDPKRFIFPEHIAADPNVTPLWELVA